MSLIDLRIAAIRTIQRQTGCSLVDARSFYEEDRLSWPARLEAVVSGKVPFGTQPLTNIQAVLLNMDIEIASGQPEDVAMRNALALIKKLVGIQS